MKVLVVLESHWGNTAAVARAIAEGIGPEAQARGYRFKEFLIPCQTASLSPLSGSWSSTA